MNYVPRAFFPAILTAAAAPCQWQQPTLSPNPGPLVGAAMAGEPGGTIVLSGGDTLSFSTGLNTQTWFYSQGVWSLSPATGPSGRSEAQLVYDLQRQVWVLYGGWTSLFSIGTGNNETWEFDGNSWSQIAPAGTPGGLWKHAMCYDVVRGVTVLFGGSTNGLPGATDGTYEYDGTTWTQRTPATTPGWREQHAMCFHQGLGVSVLFGGFNPQANSVQNQTWTYDGTNWSQVAAVGPQPPARASAEMVYDPARGVCVMHGGNNNSGTPFTDTWEFDGVTWTQIPGTGPGGRSFGCAFDNSRRLVVRHGGFGHTDETWTFGATAEAFGTGCAGSGGVPALTAASAPRLGQSFDLSLGNLSATTPAGFFVLSLTATPPTPLDPIGMLTCTGYVAPDTLIGGTTSGGTVTASLALPGNLALVGASLYAQGLSLDAGFNPAWLVTSNALQGVLGR